MGILPLANLTVLEFSDDGPPNDWRPPRRSHRRSERPCAPRACGDQRTRLPTQLREAPGLLLGSLDWFA